MSSTRDESPTGDPRSPAAPRILGRAAAALLLGVVPALTGCNLNYQRPVEPAMNPTEEDAAIAYRRGQWPAQSTDALYANTGVTAYANRFRYNYATQSQQSAYAGVITGPVAFVAQAIVFPLTFIRAPFGAMETYRPLTVEPSYTGIPRRDPLEPVDPPAVAPVPDPVPAATQPAAPVPEVTPRPSSTPGTPAPGTPAAVPDVPAAPAATSPGTAAPPAVPGPTSAPVDGNK